MKISIGFSPCPNDTFIFDALVHHKIDTEGLDFDYHLADVEQLNRWAFEERLHISKVSFHAFLFLADRYILLNSGAALGFGTGPLLIARELFPVANMINKTIAIPGKYTTANLLFTLAYGNDVNKKEMLFSEIEDAVLKGRVDAGVIIHENRFTFRQKGLIQIADLGSFWERLTSSPIPLGGIVASRKLPVEVISCFDRVLHRSVEYALQQNKIGSFIRNNAQELDDEIIKQHIGLYVNNFSLSLGTEGINAIATLFQMAFDHRMIPAIPDGILSGD